MVRFSEKRNTWGFHYRNIFFRLTHVGLSHLQSNGTGFFLSNFLHNFYFTQDHI